MVSTQLGVRERTPSVIVRSAGLRSPHAALLHRCRDAWHGLGAHDRPSLPRRRAAPTSSSAMSVAAARVTGATHAWSTGPSARCDRCPRAGQRRADPAAVTTFGRDPTAGAVGDNQPRSGGRPSMRAFARLRRISLLPPVYVRGVLAAVGWCRCARRVSRAGCAAAMAAWSGLTPAGISATTCASGSVLRPGRATTPRWGVRRSAWAW